MFTDTATDEAQPIDGYGVGAEVFILASTPDFIGVRLLVDPDPDAGTVPVEVVYTAGIPGYVRGQRLDLPADSTVYGRLTVAMLAAMFEGPAAHPGTCVYTDHETDDGDTCLYSGQPVTAGDPDAADVTCPDECRAGGVERTNAAPAT